MAKALAGIGATSLAGIAGSRAGITDYVAGPKGNSMADVGNFSFAARLVCCSIECLKACNLMIELW